MPTIIDYSQPLATVMKEITAEVHSEVEHSDGAALLLSGLLPKEEYARFLMMLWYIYDTFERALDRHSSHPVLEPTYNPPLLRRAPALAADISSVLQVPEASWKSHPIHLDLMSNTPPALTAYIQRIQQLSDSEDPSPLLAHSYVRYLGDLSGGQTIRATLGKAYGLDNEHGLAFYIFKELKSSKPATIGEMKRIKDWFRNGMNEGGKACKDNIRVETAEEAKNVFILNSGLFNSIRATPTKHNPLMDISPKPKHNPLMVNSSPSVLNKSYPLSSIIAVIAAVCLAHFILVVGGFTGDKGYGKLLAVQDWIASFFESS